MAGEVKELSKGEVLFREGDASDALYVIKKGRISVTKAKGSGEIELAELKPGEMIGEMAFFDNKPRSAGAKAKSEATVIVLPFSSLYAQFKTFPEWLKAMVKTINSKLRDANAKIKNLEQLSAQETTMFTSHMITRLCAIIALIGYKSGEKVPGGAAAGTSTAEADLVIPYFTLRNYCIQIFQAPTNKLDRMMEALQGFQIMKVEDLGEGKKKVTLHKHRFLAEFVDWYNEYLFKDETKRVSVDEKELPALKAILFYGQKATPDAQGLVQVSLTEIQNNSMKDLGQLINVNATDSLAGKGLVQEKQSGEGGVLTQKFNLAEVQRITPFWELVHALLKVPA
jgi:CRP/FNR family transcriptional regulator, cyclic AMP receptor protein